MPSIFDLELDNDAIPGYKVAADLGGTTYYRLQKVIAPDKSARLWKRIDLPSGGSQVETRTISMLSKLQHPGLNQILHLYRVDAGKTIIIESELPVQSLKDRLCESAKGSRGTPVAGHGIPPEELLRYMDNVADGLDYLNTPQPLAKGERPAILHRALRPECLAMFDSPEGRVCRIYDFGVAKAVTDNESVQHSQGLSQQEFSPPEFVDGNTAPSSDQFSLAAVYYYLRTSDLPYKGTLLQQMQAQMNDRPNLDLVPPPEREAIKRALSRDPAKRYPNCRAFVQQLRQSMGLQAAPQPQTKPTSGSFPGVGTGAGSGVAPATPAKAKAVFYSRGTGLSQSEIELPPMPGDIVSIPSPNPEPAHAPVAKGSSPSVHVPPPAPTKGSVSSLNALLAKAKANSPSGFGSPTAKPPSLGAAP